MGWKSLGRDFQHAVPVQCLLEAGILGRVWQLLGQLLSVPVSPSTSPHPRNNSMRCGGSKRMASGGRAQELPLWWGTGYLAVWAFLLKPSESPGDPLPAPTPASHYLLRNAYFPLLFRPVSESGLSLCPSPLSGSNWFPSSISLGPCLCLSIPPSCPGPCMGSHHFVFLATSVVSQLILCLYFVFLHSCQTHSQSEGHCEAQMTLCAFLA